MWVWSWSRCTPELGLHQAVTASTGDIMIHENRIMTSLSNHDDYESLRESLEADLGVAWDQELEWYRRGTVATDLDNRATM